MKIICIGCNYVEYVKEFNNLVLGSLVVFMKLFFVLLVNNKFFYYLEFIKDLYYEIEVVLKIGKNGCYVQLEFVVEYYLEIGLGIDFMACDVQQCLKDKGYFWEIVKGFDGLVVISDFLFIEQCNWGVIEFELKKNGEMVQYGNIKDFFFFFDVIIVYVLKFFKL